MGSCGISRKNSNNITVNERKISNTNPNANNQQAHNRNNQQNDSNQRVAPDNNAQNDEENNEDQGKDKTVYDARNNDPQNKFKDLDVYENDFSGEGIKKMKAYKWNAPYDQLYKLRQEFWLSKKEDKKIWTTIKQACESDHLSAQALLASMGLIFIDGCMNQLLDDNNDRIYTVPNFCINDPLYKKEIKPVDSVKVENIVINIVDIFDPKKETPVKVPNNVKFLELKKCYAKAKKIDLEQYKIRCLFQGSEILNDHLLSQHNIVHNSKLQFVIQKIEIEEDTEKDDEEKKEDDDKNENNQNDETLVQKNDDQDENNIEGGKDDISEEGMIDKKEHLQDNLIKNEIKSEKEEVPIPSESVEKKDSDEKNEENPENEQIQEIQKDECIQNEVENNIEDI